MEDPRDNTQDTNSWETVLSPSPDISMTNVMSPGDDAVDEKSSSPVSEFIADEEATSTCPLLTPSPPPDFGTPLNSGLAYEQHVSPTSTDKLEIATPLASRNSVDNSDMLPTVTSNKHTDCIRPLNPTSSVQSVVESSSSGSSVLHETTASDQLLHSHQYHQLTKTNNCPETGGMPALAGIQLAVVHRSPNDFPFMLWNWSLIRKLSLLTVLMILMGCLGYVCGIVSTLSANCDPPLGWWQGSLFYEIFPASFKDSDSDGMGDFQGIISQVDYLRRLGVEVVHLDSFLSSTQYPRNYYEIYNYSSVNPLLGSDQDFDDLVKTLHSNTMRLVVNIHTIPHPQAKRMREEDARLREKERLELKKKSGGSFSKLRLKLVNETDIEDEIQDEYESNLIPLTLQQFEEEHLRETITKALVHWSERGVDGFYMVGIEHFITLPNIAPIIRKWRRILNVYSDFENRKILIFNGGVFFTENEFDKWDVGRAMLDAADLIDIHLDVEWSTAENIKDQISDVLEGFIYSKPDYPWIHWNMGDIQNQRLSTQLNVENGTISALMVLLMLPGSPSIFYGDEIGIKSLESITSIEMQKVDNVPLMKWFDNGRYAGFTEDDVDPWQKTPESQSFAREDEAIPLINMAMKKQYSITLSMNGIWKHSSLAPNCNVMATDNETLIIERMYPRHSSYVLVANLGPRVRHHNLAKMFYGGEVVADFNGKTGEFIKLRSITLYPGQAMLVQLDQ